ncbi:UDP-glucose:glycoprotein glucosyltransferase 1-like [Liolophura sinensis]|uniref:UDP-glucose:glycoprotein glucosyltransferase 1-like n=1 Tax=Liolophura sinensis TaxID=3198878 RepID=UPI0031582FBE
MGAACCLLIVYMLCLVEAKPKYVSQVLEAKWQSTPLLLEASEYIAKEGNDQFWAFVNDVARLKVSDVKSDSDQSHYHLIQKLASKQLSPIQLNLLKFSLSLREYSPTVEMYNQIARENEKAEQCSTFAVVHGETTCDAKKVKNLIKSAESRPKPPVYTLDHVYPGQNRDVVVVLYAELGTEEFKQFHSILQELAAEKKISYILRHYTQKLPDKKVRLSGYGVELAIKSTEYKAKDDTKVKDEKDKDKDEADEGEDEIQGFIFSTLKEKYPDKKKELRELKMHLSDTATELSPLKVWQLQDLSLQAAQRVVSADASDALNHLTQISQNFPQLARSLVRQSVKSELREEIHKNQMDFDTYHNLGAGESAMFLNGLPVDLEIYDIFTLLGVMRSEAKVMEGLFSLGLRGDRLNQMLKLDLKTEESYALDTRHSAVQNINDLEKDKKYKTWPSSTRDILQPTFPGMLRHIAKNFFNLVFIVDPMDKNSRELLKMAEAFYVHSAPMRIGIIFVVDFSKDTNGFMDAGVALTRAFDFIKTDEKPSRALSFITDVYQKAGANPVSVEDVIAEFKGRYKDTDMDMVFGDTDDYDDVRQSCGDFLRQTGLQEFPQVLLNGVPLKRESLNEDGFEEVVVTEVLRVTPILQRAVYNGDLTDNMDVTDWLMDRENVMPRLNSRVLSPSTQFLDFTENIDGDIFNSEDFEQLTPLDMSSVIAQNMNYLVKKEDDSAKAVTIWVVADLETAKGRELAYSAIKSLKSTPEMRLGFIFNPVSLAAKELNINKAVHVAMATLSGHIAKSFVTKLVKEENVAALNSGAKTLIDLEVNGMDMKAYLAALKKESNTVLKNHKSFVEKAIKFDVGVRGVIANGRVLGPFGEDENFIQEDFTLLEKYTFQTSGMKIQRKLTFEDTPWQEASEQIMKTGALLSSRRQSDTSRKELHFKGKQHSVVHIKADVDAPTFEVEAILDPLTREAQKMAPILAVLKEVANVNIRIFMNCRDKLSEMPLKNFYRYVLEPEIRFKVDGSYSAGPSAKFTDMPQKSLLTLNMDPPESWLVESVMSPYDLDNILLEEVATGVNAIFELEYLLLEGHCYDSVSGQPPRGLQFVLGTNSTPAVMDTIVMANLGYFQLKATPGVWFLRLREGRSSDIYDISTHDFTDTPEGSSDLVVAINSFKSKIIKVRVAKKKEKLKEDLLKDEEEKPGIWDSISNTITGSGTPEETDSTLNIFSVASGHLYERFLRIMMLSVLKNTKSKVKFWFLKNYLSPTFKDFIPYMAEHYGFEYELVQYKWPRWLHQQTEKQRIIWGYKILFLDVLFPLHVKKFIFVDADQIVRTDLQELHDLDLEGAPYGYTPFCDSRKEMDGFRFWKSGYWASHLGHRKYHISALYVVDLKKFRRIAAGDRLRGQYQGLSQDPNSLSNLDQDLPNNMIHQVSIKSLPQEWLFCETWCSDEELARAKTIDLCNNPLTKEPKLKAAMRIVPEWKNYDYEIKLFWDSVYGTNTAEDIEYEKPFQEDSSNVTPRTDL